MFGLCGAMARMTFCGGRDAEVGLDTCGMGSGVEIWRRWVSRCSDLRNVFIVDHNPQVSDYVTTTARIFDSDHGRTETTECVHPQRQCTR